MNLEKDIIIGGTVAPHREIGAYEALWSTGVSSFKQVRDKLESAHAQLPSELVDEKVSNEFYKKTADRLSRAGVESFGVRIDGTADYPKKLHDADHPLVLLYFQGTWDLIFNRGISVVGTRKPSDAGVKRTQTLVQKLVEKGFTIYSGLAAGIDTVAHKTAIECGGSTVAVLGTPLSHFYPKDNSHLQKEIAQKHLLISQVPVCRYDQNNPQFNRFYFPERNKTMSALSEASIIVEAGETSGTLIQARAALKQGRKLFILNNNFENKSLTWPEKFLKLGAIRVKSFSDIEEVLERGE